MPVQRAPLSPVRLLAFFIGGLLLANLVLFVSGAFNQPAAEQDAPLTTGSAPDVNPAQASATDGVGHRDNPDTEPAASGGMAMPDQPLRPSMAAVCPEARERLVSGLTLYYLQRGRHWQAPTGDVLESAGMSVLLAGPPDPALETPEAACPDVAEIAARAAQARHAADMKQD